MHEAPIGYRRNMILLVGNYVTFGLGLALFSTYTVVPVFLQHLTDSTPFIGLVTAIFPLCWMLPQLIAARWISGKPNRKPFLVYLSMGAPLIYAILAGFMFTTDPTSPDNLLFVFIICTIAAGLIDGLIGVPWLDFVGRAIPGNLRGRMMGVQEMLYAIASVGIGALIAYMLSDTAPPFPDNFAWLAVAASVAFFIALLFFIPLVEPESRETTSKQPAWSEYLPLLGKILRKDRPFVTMIAVRILNGFTGLALPFYILYATTELGIPVSVTGLYLAAQVIGSAAGSMALGYLYDRRGSRLVIRIVTLLGLLAPIGALLIPSMGLTDTALGWAFALVFFVTGISGTSAAALFIGYTNFVIDHSTPANRPAYFGLSNTLAGPLALTAMLGGWIVQQTNYHVLFVVTAVMLLGALVLSFWLPEPRLRASAGAMESMAQD